MFKKVVIFSTIAAIGLYAQDDQSTKLNKTVITATGFESPLKDEVKNVYIVTAEEIANRGYRDVQEVLEKAPGVSFLDAGFGSTIDLRGQGVKANTSVKVLLNGVSMNMLDTSHAIVPINLIAIEDIEQIEIIPGGGSVLYGNGTSGGVINIITKQKPRDFYANISSKIASYSYKDLNLAIGGMATDKLFLKANFKGFDEKGYRRGDKTEGFYTGLGINYQISDNQSIVFNPSYYRAKVDGSSTLTKAQLDEDRRRSGDPSERTTETKADFSLDYKIAFSDKFEMNIMPYYQEIEMKTKTSKFADKKTGVNLKGKYNYKNGEIIAGYDYLYNNGIRKRDISYSNLSPMILSMKNYTFLDLDKQTHSIYFLEKHNFTDKFSLSAGYRFEKALYGINRLSTTTMVMPMMTTETTVKIDEDKSMNNHAFEIAPNFKYSDTGNVYIKFEKGYISPSPTQLTDRVYTGTGTTTEYRINNLKPESFYTYEIGLKDLILDQYFSATAFMTDTKDEIVNEMLGSSHATAWRFYNIDKTRRVGFEIYSEQNLLSKLRLSQTLSYVNAKIKKGSNQGKKVPLVPKSKFVFGVDYEPIKGLNLLTDLKYYSSMNDSSYNKIDSRVTVDLGVKYEIYKNFSIIGGVKNLFNEKYNIYQNKSNDSYTPAPERNYYVEFKYAY